MKISLPLKQIEPYLISSDNGTNADSFINAFYFGLSDEDRAYLKNKVIREKMLLNDALLDKVLPSLDDEEKNYFNSIAATYGLNKVKLLSKEAYVSNPYYQALKGLKEQSLGQFKLLFDAYKPFEVFTLNTKKVDFSKHYEDISPLGCFSSKFSFPCIQQNGRTWMSLVPHEIETMKEGIASSKGKVLTLGCGLGYFAFMASNKSEVDSVTIVEKDKSVIALFSEALLPLFPHKEKIKLVQADAFNYLESLGKEEYDYLYADLWHDCEDGLEMYQKLLKLEMKARQSAYWIEKDILVYARRHLIELIEEELEGFDDDQFKGEETLSDSIVNAMHFYLKGKEIKAKEELHELLSDSSLKEILKSI